MTSFLRTGDILLWKPLKPREYLISWALRSPYHHASLVSCQPEPVSLDQNIDLVSEAPVPIDKLLASGYKFDVIRYRHEVSDLFLDKVRDNFERLRSFPYSYWMALRVPLGYSYLPKFTYPVSYELVVNPNNQFPRSICIRFRSVLSPAKKISYRECYSKLTCSGAVALAYSLSGLNCCRCEHLERVRHPVLFLPDDFLKFEGFMRIGELSSGGLS